MQQGSSDPALELVFVCLESFLAHTPPKKRVAFLKDVLERFERYEDAPVSLKIPDCSECRSAAHRALRDRLPKLMAP